MGKKGKKHKKKRLFTKKELTKEIVRIFKKDINLEFNYKQISENLGIRDMPTKQMITVVLFELEESGIIESARRGKYKYNAGIGCITGTVEITNKGYGYIHSDEIEEPIFVSQANLKQALPKDTVKVMLYAKRKKKEYEGEVVEVLKRAQSTFVGIIQKSKYFAFLVPSMKMNHDIFIPKEKLHGAKDGQRAIVKLTDWPEHARNPFGEVIDILGNIGDNNAEMHAILAEYDLPYKFPSKIEKLAEHIPMEIPKEEIRKRRDFRNITTFTIDPADAKDFDDALSIQRLENGNWEIGVHIADVTHYVHTNSAIEKEAYQRATSVYLVDRVVPMLPEKLSNGVCSLRPHEEKLCFSAVFEINHNGAVLDQWFGRTVIYSDHRFTYEEAQAIIEGGEGPLKEEVLTLDELAKKLRTLRFHSGAMEFDRVEVKFNLDPEGRPTGVYFKESKDSNKLIEEFMLLANKRVAEFIGKKERNKRPKTFVYRIHDKPDPEKLDNFNSFISKFGYNIHTNSIESVTESMSMLLKNVEGKKEQNVIETLAIRTMAKARYSTRNIGHYGLQFEYYSHFTSPIRRYPDMMVHRLLDRYLSGGRSANETRWEEMCKHASEMEIKASQAERASIKYKQVEYMADKIGIEYDGVISGVTEWGIYVELNDTKCEGMVMLQSMDDDFYEFDQKNYCIIGRHKHQKYQLGDEVNIRVLRVNLEKKQLDFKLLK